jgi:hypothetical protein
MESLISFFEGIDPVLAALIATTFTWLVTAAGASLVFFFKELHRGWLDGMLGFTGGVMVAASFWSLLNPSIELSEKLYPSVPWMPAAVGFFTGAFFLYILDKRLPHLHINFKETETEGVKTQLHKTVLLVLAITLHNIPEGLAVGVLFGAAATGMDGATIGGAVALAIGIGSCYASEKGRCIPMEEFLVWTAFSDCRTCRGSFRSFGGHLYSTDTAICAGFCCRSNDLRGCGRGDTGNAKRQVYRRGRDGIHRWISGDDDPGCSVGLIFLKINFLFHFFF